MDLNDPTLLILMIMPWRTAILGPTHSRTMKPFPHSGRLTRLVIFYLTDTIKELLGVGGITIWTHRLNRPRLIMQAEESALARIGGRSQKVGDVSSIAA